MAVSANITRIVKEEIARFNKEEQQNKTPKGKRVISLDDEKTIIRNSLFLRIRESLIRQGVAKESDFMYGIQGVMHGSSLMSSETYQYVVQEIAKLNPIKSKSEYIRSLVKHNNGETNNPNSFLPKSLLGKVDLLALENDILEERKEQYKQKTDMSFAGKAASTVAELVSNPIEAVAGGGIVGKAVKGTKTVMTPVASATAAKTKMPSVVKYTPNALGRLLSKAGILPEKATSILKTAGALLGTSLVVTLPSCVSHEEIDSKKDTIPEWMPKKFGITAYSCTDMETLQKALSFAKKNADYYKKAADNAEKTGHSLVIGNKKFSSAQLRQKAIEYSLFAEELRQTTTVPNWMMSKYGMKSLQTASDKQLSDSLAWAERNMSAYISMAQKIGTKGKDGKLITAVKTQSGKVMSLSDIDKSLSQYRTFITEIDKEQDRRIQQRISEEKSQQASYQAAMTTESEESSQSEAIPQQQQSSQPLQQLENGWGKLFAESGLADFLKNPGLTIAMLPEMLFGMVSGDKETSFGLNKSTMLPLAAIIASKFISNPILKVLFLTGGGLGLLGKTAKEISPGKQEVNQYKQYPDEVLNERISNVTVNGNMVLMDIDGVPRSIVLPTQAAEAYRSGGLTQNTLANAILKKYDEQSQQMAQNFEQHQTNTVGIGIK